MGEENKEKAIINAVMDFCMSRNYLLSQRFALQISPKILKQYLENKLSQESLNKIIKEQNEFILANDLDAKILCNYLYICIDNLLGNMPRHSLLDVLVSFKIEVERNLFKAFSVTVEPQEETGRTLLQAFLPKRGYREVETGGGQMDLLYVESQQIIETKIWRDQDRYCEGLEELYQYMISENYHEGYYVLFDKTQSDNLIVKENKNSIFELLYKDKLIHVIFIKIKPVAPSKRRAFDKGGFNNG